MFNWFRRKKAGADARPSGRATDERQRRASTHAAPSSYGNRTEDDWLAVQLAVTGAILASDGARPAGRDSCESGSVSSSDCGGGTSSSSGDCGGSSSDAGSSCSGGF